MNFLAHAHLSGDNDDILFGNFIADAVKGKQIEKYNLFTRKGIALHRKIDSFTDAHELFRRSVERVKPEYGRYAGVVVDIYYDHFLASSWRNFHPVPLEGFARRVYTVLSKRFFILPDRTRRMLPFLIAQNWLVSYGRLDGLERVFRGMDRRTGLLSGMGNAVEGLEKHFDDLQNDFAGFYPQLEEFAAETLSELLSSKA